MPGHSFEDRQRKAGYSSFVRAPVDRTPAPTRGTISFGSSDPAKKSNREFNEELERLQREQEQDRGTPLTGQGSTVNTQEQIQNLRNIGGDTIPRYGNSLEVQGVLSTLPLFRSLQQPR